MDQITNQFTAAFSSRLLQNESLSKHVNFKIGGPARWFIEVKTEQELQDAVRIATEANVPYFVLGGGSNILVSDQGFDGIVIKMGMREFRQEGTQVVADAGVMSAALARATAQAGLAGFEWAISLPGTIGGAVRGNAGCFGGETGDVVSSVRVLRLSATPPNPPLVRGGIVTLDRDDLRFAYRDSAIKHSTDIVVSVVFELTPADKNMLAEKQKEILTKRKSTQPTNAPSAGCMFKNVEITQEQIDPLRSKRVPEEYLEKMRVPAGWIVDELGLKGYQLGRVKVSEEHGNFLLNLGGASADELLQLTALIKTRARNTLGLQLQEEVQLVGFNS